MADFSKIKIGNSTFDVKDAAAARRNVYYGTCTTAANTYKKVATVETFPLDGNGKPLVGTVVAIKYSYSNSYKTEGQTYQLNVNSTGDYPMYYNNAELATSTSANTLVAGYKNRHIFYMFNGTQWVWLTASYDSNSTYSNASLGQGYGTQSNESAATAITVTLGSYALTTGGIVAVKFAFDVPASATLNVNGKGAKAIYNKGAAITAGVIKAGDVATFVYSTYYHLLAIDAWQDKADVDDIPTKTSDLTNDSGFITSSSVPSAATATPLMDGTAAVGSSSKYAKEDHVHPSDTSKEDRQQVLLYVSGGQNAIVFKDNNTTQLTHAEVKTLLDNKNKDVVLILDEDPDYSVYRLTTSDPSEGLYAFICVSAYDLMISTLELTYNSSTNAFSQDSDNLMSMSYYHPANAITSANITAWNNKADKTFVVTIVNAGNNTYSCDKTNAEIYAAWQAGRNIIALYNDEGWTYHLFGEPTSTDAAFIEFEGDSIEDVEFYYIYTRSGSQTVYHEVHSFLGANAPAASITSAMITGWNNKTDLKVGSVAGKMYRNNVGGTGNFTVSGNSGCIPNLIAGTFLVAIYAKSDTQSYTFRFNFGSQSYDLSTTNGEISDVRTITLSSTATFSGSVVGTSVASGTILYVVMYNYLTPVTTIGPAAVTNRYADLDGTPTIPTVNNGTLTIQSHGTTVGTFTANQSGNTTADITTTVVTVSTTGAVSQAMDAYKFYKFTGSPTSLTLTLNSVGSGLAMYGGKFTANSSGCTMTLPSGVTVAPNAPTIEGGKTYEFNIADNVLLMVEV